MIWLPLGSPVYERNWHSEKLVESEPDGLAGSELVSTRLPELDGLRGVAIVLVITKHYELFRVPAVVESGWADGFHLFYTMLSGLDLFFILSGFLLGSGLLETLGSRQYYRDFYRKRYYRTFPAYYLLLGVFTALALFGTPIEGYYSVGHSWPFSIPWLLAIYGFFLQNIWMACEGSSGPPELEHTWSLALQIQFYLLLPQVLRWTPHRWLVIVLTGLILVAPLGRLLLICFDPMAMRQYYDCLLLFRMDTIGAGILLAVLLRDSRVRRFLLGYRSCLVPIWALLLSFAFLWATPTAQGPMLMHVVRHFWLTVLYSILVLIAVFCRETIVSRLLRVGIIRELGIISYGLFLYHQIINRVVHSLLLGTTPSTGDSDSLLATMSALLVTIVLAEASWHFLEQPLIRRGKSQPRFALTEVSSPLIVPSARKTSCLRRDSGPQAFGDRAERE